MQSIADVLSALYPAMPTLELRVMVNGHINSGYFNDYQKLEAHALKYQKQKTQCYFTINPCKEELIARYFNRVEEYAKDTTVDRDIETRLYLPLDFDPIRASGISSTNAQHKAARSCAAKARDYLSEIGWSAPIEFDSGNGAYLLYAIDLPNDDDSKELIKTVLQVCDHLFSDQAVKVDTTMFNAARIVRLPGTKNTKGDSTEDRPHRTAQVLNIPEKLVPISKQLLEHLAGLLPKAPKPEMLAQKLDLGVWLAENGLEVIGKDRWNDALKYTLAHCAFNAQHSKPIILQFDNGGYDYRCLHDSCSSNRWREFTKLYPLPSKGATKSAKIIAKLNELGYFFKLNICADRLECNGLPMTNALAAKIRVQMVDRNVKPIGLIEDAYYANALDNSYHPVQDYLNQCGSIFDGKLDYVRVLAEHLSDIHDPIGLDRIAYLWLKRWLLGAVAKVFEAEQNPMLVLDGRQDLGKSTFVRYLASGLPQYFIEGAIDPTRADDKLRLIQSWIWEVAELGATTRKADIEGLKAFITMRDVTVRRPYDKYDMHKPPMASLIGTVNDDGGGFLADNTGNRRFLTMTLAKIDFGYTRIPIDQVWGQAVAMYRNGNNWRLEASEKEHQATINQTYEIDDPYVAMLQKHFTIDPTDRINWIASFTIMTILQELEGIKADVKRLSMEISKALKKLKVTKERKNAVNGYYGLVPRQSLLMNFSNKKVSANNGEME